MYRVDRNNFYEVEKKATIETPDKLSEFLFDLLDSSLLKKGLIFDPCVGSGSLLKPFLRNQYKTLGLDICYQGFKNTLVKNYLDCQVGEIKSPSLIIMNPPFNIDKTTKEHIRTHYSGRPLLPEIWLSKALKLFGLSTPIAMFTPYGFRLNQSQTSKRWKKFETGEYPEICSIMSLPKNVFKDVLFHSEILFFNLPHLKPHYFFHG